MIDSKIISMIAREAELSVTYVLGKNSTNVEEVVGRTILRLINNVSKEGDNKCDKMTLPELLLNSRKMAQNIAFEVLKRTSNEEKKSISSTSIFSLAKLVSQIFPNKETAILTLIKELAENAYGHELMKSAIKMGIPRGTVYTSLKRLRDKGWIEISHQEVSSKNGAIKKFYRITSKGSAKLQEAQKVGSTGIAAYTCKGLTDIKPLIPQV